MIRGYKLVINFHQEQLEAAQRGLLREVKEFAAVGITPNGKLALRIQFDPPEGWTPPNKWGEFEVETKYVGLVKKQENGNDS